MMMIMMMMIVRLVDDDDQEENDDDDDDSIDYIDKITSATLNAMMILTILSVSRGSSTPDVNRT